MAQLENPLPRGNATRFRTFLAAAAASALMIASAGRMPARAAEANIPPQTPRYEVQLTSDEYPPFQVAAEFGVKRYHADADFAVKMSLSAPNTVLYTVNVVDPKLLDIWSQCLADTKTTLLRQQSVHQADEATTHTLAMIDSAKSKVDLAKAHPVWDPITLLGRVADRDGKLYLQTDAGDLEITGNRLADLKPLTDKTVYAAGYLKTKGQFEVANYLERRDNTLELFVMSHCPFGKQAEAQILSRLKDPQYAGKPPFTLNVHYIIYKKDENGKTTYSSLHGPDELDEDVVQMVIRDRYPKFFNDYLQRRVMSDDPWQKLAADAGMDAAAIADVDQHAKSDRDQLIANEYKYATSTYQITNGSPTFVWESVKVDDPTVIPGLKGLTFLKDTCSGDPNKAPANPT